MAIFRFSGFRGMFPRINARMLAEGASILAENCRFDGESLAPERRWKNTPVDVTAETVNNPEDYVSLIRYSDEWNLLNNDKVIDAAWMFGRTDDTERMILTGGDLPPRFTSSNLLFSAGFSKPIAEPVVSGYKYLRILPPEYPPNVALVGTADDATDVPETRFYTVTFVDDWNFEGPPSSASQQVEWRPGQTVRLTNFAQPPIDAEYDSFKDCRVYRVNTTAGGTTQYQFVTQLSISDASTYNVGAVNKDNDPWIRIKTVTTHDFVPGQKVHFSNFGGGNTEVCAQYDTGAFQSGFAEPRVSCNAITVPGSSWARHFFSSFQAGSTAVTSHGSQERWGIKDNYYHSGSNKTYMVPLGTSNQWEIDAISIFPAGSPFANDGFLYVDVTAASDPFNTIEAGDFMVFPAYAGNADVFSYGKAMANEPAGAGGDWGTGMQEVGAYCMVASSSTNLGGGKWRILGSFSWGGGTPDAADQAIYDDYLSTGASGMAGEDFHLMLCEKDPNHDDFLLRIYSPVGKQYRCVEAIQQTDPGRVRLRNHGLNDGDYVTFNHPGSTGMTQIDGESYFIEYINEDTFDLYTDAGLTTSQDLTSGYTAWTNGEGVFLEGNTGMDDLDDTTHVVQSVPDDDPRAFYIYQDMSTGNYPALVSNAGIVNALPLDTFVDDIPTESLGEVLSTVTYDAPPEKMKGIVTHPGGFFLGYKGNTLCMSEPGQPHAWPFEYQLDTADAILGLAVFSNQVLVVTQGAPCIAIGNVPASMVLTELESEYAGISHGSIVDIGMGACYASHDGLVLVLPNSLPTLITDGIYKRDEWKDLNPGTWVSFYHRGRYCAFYEFDGSRKTWMMNPTSPDEGVVEMDFGGTAVYRELADEKTYFLSDQSDFITEWATNPTIYHTYRWRSGHFLTEKAVNMAAAKVYADSYNNLTFRLYADTNSDNNFTLEYTHPVTSERAFRLPGGFRAEKWYIEIEGTDTVTEVVMTTTMQEMSRVV